MGTHKNSMKRGLFAAVTVVVAASFASHQAEAQGVDPTGPAIYSGGIFSENFNLAGADGTTTILPAGFFGLTSPAVVSDLKTFRANASGSVNGFSLFGPANERAFGTSNPGANTQYLSLEIRNDSTLNRPLVATTFNLENYGATPNETFELFAYISAPGTPLTAIGMQDRLDGSVFGDNFFSLSNNPLTLPTPGNSTAQSVTIPAINGRTFVPGSYLYLAFKDNSLGSSAFALDNFTLQAVPEPSTWIAAGLLLGTVGFARVRRSKANELPMGVA